MQTEVKVKSKAVLKVDTDTPPEACNVPNPKHTKYLKHAHNSHETRTRAYDSRKPHETRCTKHDTRMIVFAVNIHLCCWYISEIDLGNETNIIDDIVYVCSEIF